MADRPMTDEQIREIVTWYNEASEELREERDARLRTVRDSGRTQAEIIRASGYSRELVRQALDPKVRAAVRKAAAERRAAQRGTAG